MHDRCAELLVRDSGTCNFYGELGSCVMGLRQCVCWCDRTLLWRPPTFCCGWYPRQRGPTQCLRSRCTPTHTSTLTNTRPANVLRKLSQIAFVQQSVKWLMKETMPQSMSPLWVQYYWDVLLHQFLR